MPVTPAQSQKSNASGGDGGAVGGGKSSTKSNAGAPGESGDVYNLHAMPHQASEKTFQVIQTSTSPPSSGQRNDKGEGGAATGGPSGGSTQKPHARSSFLSLEGIRNAIGDALEGGPPVAYSFIYTPLVTNTETKYTSYVYMYPMITPYNTPFNTPYQCTL